MGKDGVTGRSGPGCDAQGRAQIRLGALCKGRDRDRVGQGWAPVALTSQDPDKSRGWGTTGVLESSERGIGWHIPVCQVHKDSHFRAPKQRASLDLAERGRVCLT